MTTYQPNRKSNPNLNPTTKLHAVVSIQLNAITYPENSYETMLLPCFYCLPLS